MSTIKGWFRFLKAFTLFPMIPIIYDETVFAQKDLLLHPYNEVRLGLRKISNQLIAQVRNKLKEKPEYLQYTTVFAKYIYLIYIMLNLEVSAYN